MNLPDRDVLENTIIPYFDKGNVCFVGIEKYTKHYPTLFPSSNLLVIDKEKRNIDPNVNFECIKLQELHLNRENYFDTIIANGIAGHGPAYGTNTEKEVEDIFNSVYHSLTSRGIFIWGHDDCNELRVIDPVFINHNFQKYVFPPLGTWRYSALNHYDRSKKYDWKWEKIRKFNHTYDFYIKS